MKAIRTISSLMLAFLVLMSSTSFMVGVHLCSGHVRDIALFSKAQQCPNEKPAPACHRHAEKSCCEDGSVIHQGEDFQASTLKFSTVELTAVEVNEPLVLIAEIVPSIPVIDNGNTRYDPPLPADDLVVEFRVLLI